MKKKRGIVWQTIIAKNENDKVQWKRPFAVETDEDKIENYCM